MRVHGGCGTLVTNDGSRSVGADPLISLQLSSGQSTRRQMACPQWLATEVYVLNLKISTLWPQSYYSVLCMSMTCPMLMKLDTPD